MACCGRSSPRPSANTGAVQNQNATLQNKQIAAAEQARVNGSMKLASAPVVRRTV